MSDIRRSKRNMLVIALLLILVHSGLIYRGIQQEVIHASDVMKGRQLVGALQISKSEVVLATADNKLLLLHDGMSIKESRLDETISAIAASADGSKVFVGTTSRNLRIYDKQLTEISHFAVTGRINAVSLQGDRLLLSYGIGQYNDKQWIGAYTEAGEEVFKTRIGFDVTAMEAATMGVFFGTEDAQIGMLDANGKELWRQTLNYPVTSMWSEGQTLLAGDSRGNIHKYDREGKILWSMSLSSYPLKAVYALSSNSSHVLAGDQNGNFYLLNEEGKKLYQNRFAGGYQTVGLGAETAGEVSVYSSAGERMTINLETAGDNGAIRAVVWTLIALDALCAVFLFRLALRSFPALGLRLKRFWKFFKRSKTAYLLIVPAFLFIFVFEVVPTAMALVYSFTNFNLSAPLAFTGLDNFRKIGSDSFFWIGIGNMVLILISSVIKELTMPLLAAELVFWLKSKRMKYFFRTGFVLTSIVPGIVVVLLWKMIYSPDSGLINELLSSLGLGHMQRAWLGDEQLAIWSIIFAGFPFISVFAFLIYLGGLIGINREIYDASQIDGINVWNRFLKIDVPLIRPQIQLILFFTFIGSIQGFANIWIFTRGGPGVSTYVPGLQMYFQISDGQYGYASAIGFVMAIMVLLVTFVNSRLSRQEEV